MTEVVEPALFAVALAGCIDEREIARGPVALRLLLFGQIAPFQRHGDFFSKADADETAGRDRVAVPDQADRIFGADDLSVLGEPGWREHRLRGGCRHGRVPQAQ
jgi:hypothetical protein